MSASEDATASEHPTHPTTVVEAIHAAITRGDFAPHQRLIEADLAEQFRASRTHIRTALQQLASVGLVERIPNRGARVRAISLDEAIEITEVRLAVEGLCAAKAAERATAADHRELRALGTRMQHAVTTGDVGGYSALNTQLHAAILRISAQTTARSVLERLQAQNLRHQFRLALHPGRARASLPEHAAIIDAICRADPASAEHAMRAHLRSVRDTLPEVADQIRPRAV